MTQSLSSSGVPRLIAFYLPQYHPVAENDRWWGKGFTEWTNVTRARPLFRGHYQPHLPADLGFYDLRLGEARQAQADLARAHGLGGFCYYHYWFGGRRLLERPFAEVLESGQPDFPFCLCWANENWTRTWDGLDREMLLEQTYSPEDDVAHIRWLARAFADPRYLRIGGKPLFIVYRSAKLPDPKRTFETWRRECRELGIGEIYLCRIETADQTQPPTEVGLDAGVDFQPDWGRLGTHIGTRTHSFLPDDWRFFLRRRLRGDDNKYHRYPRLVDVMKQRPRPPYRVFPCVTPSWDNSARRSRGAAVILDSDPALFEGWLRDTIEREARSGAADQVVFINAWNEWAEGAHLEPDQRYGLRYLEAVKRAAAPGSV